MSDDPKNRRPGSFYVARAAEKLARGEKLTGNEEARLRRATNPGYSEAARRESILARDPFARIITPPLRTPAELHVAAFRGEAFERGTLQQGRDRVETDQAFDLSALIAAIENNVALNTLLYDLAYDAAYDRIVAQGLPTNSTEFNTAVAAAAPVQSVAGKTGDVDLVVADITGFNAAASAAAPVQSVAGKTGDVDLEAADIGDFAAEVVAASPVKSVATKTGIVSLVPADITGFNAAASAAAPVQSVAGRTGTVTLLVADITDVSIQAVATCDPGGTLDFLIVA